MKRLLYSICAAFGLWLGILYAGSPPPSPHPVKRSSNLDTLKYINGNDTLFFVRITGNEWRIVGDSSTDTLTVGNDGLTIVDSLAIAGDTWKVYYSDGNGRLIGVTLGSAGQVLKSNGATSAPTWQNDSIGSGTGGGLFDSSQAGATDSFFLVGRDSDTAMFIVMDTAVDTITVDWGQSESQTVRIRNVDRIDSDSLMSSGVIVIGGAGHTQVDTIFILKGWIGTEADSGVVDSELVTKAYVDAGDVGAGTSDSIAWDSAGNATNPGYTYPTMIRPGGGVALTVDTDSGYIHVKPGSGIDTASGLVKVKPGTGIDTTGGTINHTAHTGDVTGATALTIGADKVLESHLKAVDAAADEDFLTYEVTVGDFEWHSIADVEPNFTLSNIGGSVTDAQVPDNITISGLTDSTTWNLAADNFVDRRGDNVLDSISVDTLIANVVFNFPVADAPAPTLNGRAAWDSSDNAIVIGDGATARVILPTFKYSGDAIVANIGTVTIQDAAVQESDLDITNAKTQGNALVGGSGDNLTYSDLNITTIGSNVQLTASGTPTVVEVGTAGHAQIDSLFTLKAWKGLEGDSSVVDSELVTRGEMRNYQVVTPHWIGGQADGPGDSVELSLGGNKGGAVYLCRDSSILTAASDTVNDTIYFAFTMPEWANTVDSIVLVMEGKNATADSAEVNGVDLMGHKSGALIPDSAYYSDNTARNNTSPTRYVYAVGNSDLTGKDMAAIRVRTTLGRNGVGVIYFYQVYAIVSD